MWPANLVGHFLYFRIAPTHSETCFQFVSSSAGVELELRFPLFLLSQLVLHVLIN